MKTVNTPVDYLAVPVQYSPDDVAKARRIYAVLSKDDAAKGLEFKRAVGALIDQAGRDGHNPYVVMAVLVSWTRQLSEDARFNSLKLEPILRAMGVIEDRSAE